MTCRKFARDMRVVDADRLQALWSDLFLLKSACDPKPPADIDAQLGGILTLLEEIRRDSGMPFMADKEAPIESKDSIYIAASICINKSSPLAEIETYTVTAEDIARHRADALAERDRASAASTS